MKRVEVRGSRSVCGPGLRFEGEVLDAGVEEQLHAVVGYAVLMVETPSSDLTRCADHIQFLPRWTYHCGGSEQEASADGNSCGCRRVDNITDAALADYRRTYGNQVTKNHIFFYIYALHSLDYRDEFAADLKKSLPRIPKADTRDTFEAFTEAGRELLDLHVDYKHAEPWIGLDITGDTPEGDLWDWYRVDNIHYGGKGAAEDKTTIVYNPRITVTGIPLEAQAYTLGGRSALDWIIERYQAKTGKTSRVVNDPKGLVLRGQILQHTGSQTAYDASVQTERSAPDTAQSAAYKVKQGKGWQPCRQT